MSRALSMRIGREAQLAAAMPGWMRAMKGAISAAPTEGYALPAMVLASSCWAPGNSAARCCPFPMSTVGLLAKFRPARQLPHRRRYTNASPAQCAGRDPIPARSSRHLLPPYVLQPVRRRFMCPSPREAE